jgi:hypothetical protein
MADVNIDGLPAATLLDGTELVECMQGGVNVQTTTGAAAGAPSLVTTITDNAGNTATLTIFPDGSPFGDSGAVSISVNSGPAVLIDGLGRLLPPSLNPTIVGFIPTARASVGPLSLFVDIDNGNALTFADGLNDFFTVDLTASPPPP